MRSNVRYLQPRTEPIALFVRIGTTGHRQLETLHSSGRFSPKRVVFEAAWIGMQGDLVSALRESGAEIVLDTNTAELSELGRFQGAARRVPWANASRQLVRSDPWKDILAQIADFAVAHGVHTILSPTHLLRDSKDEWLPLDISLCSALRDALDSRGGRHVAIDYPLLTTYGALRDRMQRRALIARLNSIPFDNLWLRVSGFGADASAVGVRRYITALFDFQELAHPIVADSVGGLAGLAVAAFGASGALAHGVAEKERFDASAWHRPRRDGGGGQSGRVYLPALDRYISLSEARALFEARGGRRILSCKDIDCCPRGADDMLRDPKAHFLNQRRNQLHDLSTVPLQRRADRFLREHLATADRDARLAAKLQPNNEELAKVVGKAALRISKLRDVLDDLHRTMGGNVPRSKCLPLRVGPTGSLQNRAGRR